MNGPEFTSSNIWLYGWRLNRHRASTPSLVEQPGPDTRCAGGHPLANDRSAQATIPFATIPARSASRKSLPL